MTNAMDVKVARAAARSAKKEAIRAAKAAFDALPAAERWGNFERIGMLLNQQQWIFAKTMAHNPHWYTLRRKWAVDADFQWVVAQIRAHGYRAKFGKTWYTQLDVNDRFYWTMGWPINWPNGVACTILINRKPLARPDEGLVAHSGDAGARDRVGSDGALVQRVLGRLGDLAGLDVLDVGCGLHRTPNPNDLASYTGLDGSRAVLDRLLTSHPTAHTVCSELRSFVPLTASGEIRRYHRVLVLFGTGNLLTWKELERLPLLLKPGGVAWVMFDEGLSHPDPTEVFSGVSIELENDGGSLICKVGSR